MSNEMKPFFAQTHDVDRNYDSTTDALADAQTYGYARLVAKNFAKLIRVGRKMDSDLAVILSTAEESKIASCRMGYFLWKHANHLFKDIFLLEARRQDGLPLHFSGDNESLSLTGLLCQTNDGKWFYASPANHSDLGTTPLTKKLQSNSLEDLLEQVESSETNCDVAKGERLFPNTKEIRIQREQGTLLEKPIESGIDFKNETRLTNNGSNIPQREKYIALDPSEFSLMEVRDNRAVCDVLLLPYIARRSDLKSNLPAMLSGVIRLIVPKF